MRKKIDDVFGHTLGTAEKRSVATLIYYPREKLEQLRQSGEDMQNWYRVTLYRLIELCRVVSSKYTRIQGQKGIAAGLCLCDRRAHHGKAGALLTRKLTMRQLSDDSGYRTGRAVYHRYGRADPAPRGGSFTYYWRYFDRGPQPHRIMDCLMDYHSLDIQWGNHDVLWMGAAAGQQACIATVIRLCLRYGNLDILEDGLGTKHAAPCDLCAEGTVTMTRRGLQLRRRRRKQIFRWRFSSVCTKRYSVIQFKIEGKLAMENPEFGMDGRRLLERIDYDTMQVKMRGAQAVWSFWILYFRR